MRRLRFQVVYLLRFWPAFFLFLFERWTSSEATWTILDSIKIVDTSLGRKIDNRFQEDTAAVLQLIKSVDPRRFRRVQKEIKRIANGESLGFAYYRRPGKVCTVDFSYITINPAYSNHREWFLWWYAMVLIHEATHGSVYTKGIFYTTALRARIERLCHTEQKRFARKADSERRQWSDTLAGVFDERQWQTHWSMNLWDMYKRVSTRMTQARQGMASKDVHQNKK